MDSSDFYTAIYDSDDDRYTIKGGPVVGVVERFYRLDEITGEQYALCYLEVMGSKIHETECFAKDIDDGLETVVVMMIELSKNLEEFLNGAMVSYAAKRG